MRLAFVTLHYKNLADTLGLLESLAACTIPEGHQVRIYVVDNQGDAKLKKEIKKYPQAKLIVSGTNLGFAAGNNLGFRQAIADDYEVIVAINNDTYAGKDFIKHIIASPITDDSVGAVGGLIYFAPGYEFRQDYKKSDLGKVVWYAGGQFDWNNILGSNDHVDAVDHGQFSAVEHTAFITGALFITRADVLKKVGLFDDNYFVYLEDVDLSHRFKLAGYSLLFDPKIKLWHKVAQSSGIGSNLNDYFITRNRLYFGAKYAKVRTKFALMREAFRFLFTGRPAQRQGVLDFLTGKMGQGTYLK